ncbi:MAG: Rpp14/Pop5 family protein [Promethearchaeota archaeon]
MKVERQRYILVEYLLPYNQDNYEIEQKSIIRAIWSSLISLFGEYYGYKTGLWIVEFNSTLRYFIIRCTNITKAILITTLTFIKKINNIPVIFHTIKTSGTLKKIRKIKDEYFQKKK